MNLHFIDYAILALYFSFVLGIGWYLRRSISTSSDFLTAGHSVPTWIASLAFLAANLGAQEVIGMCASGAKYGIMTAHFYWIGAVPAMLFVGVFMMPFYYGSKARSVPEYLKLRFDEKTRGLNAITFAAMTLFSSGGSMYALALLLKLILDWDFTTSVLLTAFIVLVYTLLGGLKSAIYNEVLQFFLIVLGFAPLAILAVDRAGGWPGIAARTPEALTHAWRNVGSPSQNPMGVEVFGLMMGLAFVLSFGYWCTDFLVVQRAMAAENMSAARRVPVIAAFPKMVMPFIVILPGIAAVALMNSGSGYTLPRKGDGFDYDQVMTTLMAQFYPSGMLGVGLTALVASFMSGMAGNVTAFNTVWTYDLYQSYIHKGAPDSHYLKMGRWATVGGILLSMATAYGVTQFNNIMDTLQLVFSFVNAPLFATFLLGMFWKRTTGHAAFTGLVSGTVAAIVHHGLTLPIEAHPGIHGGWIAVVHNYPSDMAQNFWTAIWAFSVNFVLTVLISLVTKAREEKDLVGLVYSLTPKPVEHHMAWWSRPSTLAVGLIVMLVALNLIFK